MMMKFGQIDSQNFQVINRKLNDVGSTVLRMPKILCQKFKNYD